MKILQSGIPYDISHRALPGVRPLDPMEWLLCDDAFAGQMARREALIEQKPQDVCQMDSSAYDAAVELLEVTKDFCLNRLGYEKQGQGLRRPDGQVIELDWLNPMLCLGRLVQNDFCILQKHGDEHVMTAAILCFPASWSLDEKFMRPLSTIHDPVDEYDDNIRRRVQRLFDGIQVGRPLWRFNALEYVDPELHQPRRMADRREKPAKQDPFFMRSERQTLLRLPKSNAVVFGIHTFVTILT